MRREPMFIIDGGHNPQCIEALVKNIEEAHLLPGRELTVLTGVLGDKDFHCMYRDVARYAKEFITITPANPRALPADKRPEYLAGSSAVRSTACQSAEEGVRLACAARGPGRRRPLLRLAVYDRRYRRGARKALILISF